MNDLAETQDHGVGYGSIVARQPADLHRRQFEIVSRSRNAKAKRKRILKLSC
jgi:hypothetical protein